MVTPLYFHLLYFPHLTRERDCVPADKLITELRVKTLATQMFFVSAVLRCRIALTSTRGEQGVALSALHPVPREQSRAQSPPQLKIDQLPSWPCQGAVQTHCRLAHVLETSCCVPI